jgi:hypothetical protein
MRELHPPHDRGCLDFGQRIPAPRPPARGGHADIVSIFERRRYKRRSGMDQTCETKETQKNATNEITKATTKARMNASRFIAESLRYRGKVDMVSGP